MKTHKLHSSQEGSPDALQLRWSRQCDALLERKEDLLHICDDLPTYEETMKGEMITSKHGTAKATFDQLPAMKEEVLQSIDQALESLGYIEQEAIEQKSYLRLEQEKERLRRVKELIEKQDLSQCPPNYAIDSGIQNDFYRFTEMKDGSQEAESLRHQTKPTGPKTAEIITLNGQQFTAAKMSVRQRGSILMKAAESAQKFSDLLLAAYARAQEKRKEQLKPKVAEMKKIYLAAVHADKLSDAERNPAVDIAEPLRDLDQTISMIADQRGADFWTADRYRQDMQRICDKAYTLIRDSGLEPQSQREHPRARGVSEAGTLETGKVSQRRSLLARLFGKKN